MNLARIKFFGLFICALWIYIYAEGEPVAVHIRDYKQGGYTTDRNSFTEPTPSAPVFTGSDQFSRSQNILKKTGSLSLV
jgi:hypothetical protein